MQDSLVAAAQRRRARLLLDLGRAEEALTQIRRCLASNPNDSESLEIEGLCHLRLSDFATAIEVLGRAVAATPDAAHPHYLLGFALREADEPARAESSFAEALRRSPDEPVYLRALAELASDLGRHDEALTLCHRATELAPERAANFVTLGFVASAAGKKDVARRAYERAVALDPADAAAWNNLGCLDLEDGRPLYAKARFREALRLDPRGERARRNLRLVQPEQAPPEQRSFDDFHKELMRELARGRAPATAMAALILESPRAARGLLSKEAALVGTAATVMLRLLGPAALGPLGVGAAAAGLAYLAKRRQLLAARGAVARVLADAEQSWNEIWRRWLDGVSTRHVRDLEIELLVENSAIRIVQGQP